MLSYSMTRETFSPRESAQQMIKLSTFTKPWVIAVLAVLSGFVFLLLRPHPNHELGRSIQHGNVAATREYINKMIDSTDPAHAHIWKADHIRLGVRFCFFIFHIRSFRFLIHSCHSYSTVVLQLILLGSIAVMDL
jgi:hypothetical protein